MLLDEKVNRWDDKKYYNQNNGKTQCYFFNASSCLKRLAASAPGASKPTSPALKQNHNHNRDGNNDIDNEEYWFHKSFSSTFIILDTDMAEMIIFINELISVLGMENEATVIPENVHDDIEISERCTLII